MQLLAQALGRLLIQLAVGVGKTTWMLRIIAHVLGGDEHDLVIVLFPRWDILWEFEQRLPTDLQAITLEPRPRDRCGGLNDRWLEYERTYCGFLGRHELCGNCPRRRGCPWPKQYGKRLRQARLILTTQQHLIQNPHFIRKLTKDTQANRPLLLLDESDFLLKNIERTISPRDLERFLEAIRQMRGMSDRRHRMNNDWQESVQLLQDARTIDLQAGNWRFPWVDPKWALAIQQVGRSIYGAGFRFLGFDLTHFSHSDRIGRQRQDDGAIRFATVPDLESHLVTSARRARMFYTAIGSPW